MKIQKQNSKQQKLPKEIEENQNLVQEKIQMIVSQKKKN